MNKPEYSDLYKFIVSLGLILIAFAMLLPWLFLRESFDALVTTSDLANLTPTAQALIAYRQNTGLWFVQNILWLSSIPAIAGFITLGSGLYLWQRKQKVLDRKDELETEKLNLEIKSMSPEQIAVKAIKETADEIQVREADEASPQSTAERINVINEYFETENIVISKLMNCFGVYDVRPNQQIGDSQVDVLVNTGRRERLIFEVKLIRLPTYINRRIRETVDILGSVVSKYNQLRPGNSAVGIGLLVISNDYPEKLPAENFNRWFEREIKNISVKIKILVLTENELKNLDCNNLRAMLEIN